MFYFIKIFRKIKNKISLIASDILFTAKEIIVILLNTCQFIKALKVQDPDIVHCHDLNGLTIGWLYAKKHPCKLIYDSHEIFEKTQFSGRFRAKIFEIIQRIMSRRVDGFITINSSIGNYLNTKYPALPPATIIKNAALPYKLSSTSNKIRELLQLPASRKIILFQGGFSLGRGLETLVQSAKYLDSDWCIVLMGWGKLHAQLEQISSKDSTLNKSVFFIDKVSQQDLLAWTSSATIGIIPYEETCLNHTFCTPNKIWEFATAELPFFATPLVELKKVITKGIGWPIELPYTPQILAKQINSLTMEQIQEAKKNCVKFSKEDNWTVYEQKLFALYKSIEGIQSLKN